MYDARQIANWFIRRAHRDKRVLTIVGVLKLTYIAHGQYLSKRGTPLFSNEIQAWRYGPVIMDVSKGFDRQNQKMLKPLSGFSDVTDPSDNELLEQVWVEYGQRPAEELSRLTHISGGPWDLARKIGGWYARIPSELIKQYHDARAASAVTHATKELA